MIVAQPQQPLVTCRQLHYQQHISVTEARPANETNHRSSYPRKQPTATVAERGRPLPTARWLSAGEKRNGTAAAVWENSDRCHD